MNIDHFDYMQHAIDLALKAKGQTSPNPMVGCVIVKNGKIVGEGYHKKCGGPHAEVYALKQAGDKAKDATMYVTLEPCCHIGRTPACVDRVIESGISKIYVAMKDPNPLVSGRSIRKMKKAGLQVEVGLLFDQAIEMNEPFLKYITTGRPFVVAKSAQTIDGKIATVSGNSKWITSEKTRKFARKKRDEFDAIVVGINTVLNDDPQLTGSRKSKSLTKVIVDSMAKIPLKSKLFDSGDEVIVAITSKAPIHRVKRLHLKGVAVVVCPQYKGGVDLRYLMNELCQMGYVKILLEGGSLLIGSALRDELVDVMQVYLAPKVLGDAKGLSSVTGFSHKLIDQSVVLDLRRVEVLATDIFLEYSIIKS